MLFLCEPINLEKRSQKQVLDLNLCFEISLISIGENLIHFIFKKKFLTNRSAK